MIKNQNIVLYIEPKVIKRVIKYALTEISFSSIPKTYRFI